MQSAQLIREDGTEKFTQLQRLNDEMSTIMDHTCSFKPEVAIMLELYEAEAEGRILSATSVGLTAGIPQSTTIRYLRYLEGRGWVTRSRHTEDARISFIRISPAKLVEFKELFHA